MSKNKENRPLVAHNVNMTHANIAMEDGEIDFGLCCNPAEDVTNTLDDFADIKRVNRRGRYKRVSWSEFGRGARRRTNSRR